MSKLTSKWITDGAVLDQHLAAGAKQGVLASKLKASRRGVLTFSATSTSSDVSTEVLAAATTDTPQTSLTAKGIYTGAVSGATDVKKVVIRAAGTDNGIADGLSDEIYGVLSEVTGTYTLTFKKSNGTSYTFSGATNIDFYFVEIFDLYDLPVDEALYGAISGVVDASATTTLSGHLDGGAGKHTSASISVTAAGTYLTSATLQVNLAALDAAIVADDGNIGNLITLSGVAANATHLGTFTGTTIPDSQTEKQALQALETAVELRETVTVVAEIDANVNDLISLSGIAENVTHLGTFTGSTIPDTSTIKAALQALETSDELKESITVVAEIDANVNDLITLSGVAENVSNLGTFTGVTIPDSSSTKAALQALETALEAVTSESEKVEYFTLSGTDITNKYVDLALVPKAANNVRMLIKSATNQFYGDDFQVITNGSVIKRVSWNSLALDTVLASGDKLTLIYTV